MKTENEILDIFKEISKPLKLTDEQKLEMEKILLQAYDAGLRHGVEKGHKMHKRQLEAAQESASRYWSEYYSPCRRGMGQ